MQPLPERRWKPTGRGPSFEAARAGTRPSRKCLSLPGDPYLRLKVASGSEWSLRCLRCLPLPGRFEQMGLPYPHPAPDPALSCGPLPTGGGFPPAEAHPAGGTRSAVTTVSHRQETFTKVLSVPPPITPASPALRGGSGGGEILERRGQERTEKKNGCSLCRREAESHRQRPTLRGGGRCGNASA